MTRIRVTLLSIALLLLTLALAPAAQAQATRTWVSGVGDDANPCSRTAPCKTFAGAISKTAANGEISVLDPGGFGVVTITKSITINGEGTLAGILNAGSSGIIINAAAADRVVIRNISINGQGSGLNGVRFLGGKELLLENVTIEGIAAGGKGVDVSLGVTGSVVELRNVTISEAPTGIRVTTSTGSVNATLEGVRVFGAGSSAVEATLNSVVSVRNSTLTSGTFGLLASMNGVINAESNTIAFNSTGVNALAGTTIRLSNNGIYNNATALNIVGIIESTGDNRFASNGGALPVLPVITTR